MSSKTPWVCGGLNHRDLLGLDLDDVLQGSEPVPVQHPGVAIVEVPPLTDIERAAIVADFNRGRELVRRRIDAAERSEQTRRTRRTHGDHAFVWRGRIRRAA